MQDPRIGLLGVVALWIIAALLLVQNFLWWRSDQLYIDEACATTFAFYGGETAEQSERLAELRAKWC
jgi:hypothetical protein